MQGFYFPRWVMALELLSMLVPANAFSADTIPAGGVELLPASSLRVFALEGSEASLGKLEFVNVDEPEFQRAMRITTTAQATEEWNVQAMAAVEGPVKSGDVVMCRFWMRCVESISGEAFTSFEFGAVNSDLENAAELRASAGGQWKEFSVPFRSPRNFPTGAARVAFRAGHDRQTMEIAGIEIINYGPKFDLDELPRTKFDYEGRSGDATWRREALARIEKIRKGDLAVTVLSAAGSPVAGARVHAMQLRHAFGFGTCVDAGFLTGNTPDDERYRRTVLSLFNRAVFENDMKWQATWNGPSAATDEALHWLREHDITVRGHNLVWPSWRWLPEELRPYRDDPVQLKAITAQHITSLVSHYRGQLVDWDVVNEPYTNHDLIDALGGQSIMVDWYKLAHQADPDCRLVLNDFGILDGPQNNAHREAFYKTIQFLLDHGAPLEGLGIQSHFGTDLPPPTQLLAILDRFAEFGLPIESTEVSFALADRQLQADYLRDYLIAMFSHPDVQAVMLWGFWAGRHWRPEAALYELDWTPRPIAQEWIDLTQKTWHTDAQMATDSQGIAHTRGFYGTYEISISAPGGDKTLTAELKPGGTELTVRLN
jgi:GH35 family endo-1,4-beta-xylanase